MKKNDAKKKFGKVVSIKLQTKASSFVKDTRDSGCSCDPQCRDCRSQVSK